MADEEQLGSEQRGLMETGLPGILSFLVQHYNLDDLQTLCFNLGANYDDLAGTTLSSKARDSSSGRGGSTSWIVADGDPRCPPDAL